MRPYDALAPVTPAPGSLNGSYHCTGTYGTSSNSLARRRSCTSPRLSAARSAGRAESRHLLAADGGRHVHCADALRILRRAAGNWQRRTRPWVTAAPKFASTTDLSRCRRPVPTRAVCGMRVNENPGAPYGPFEWWSLINHGRQAKDARTGLMAPVTSARPGARGQRAVRRVPARSP